MRRTVHSAGAADEILRTAADLSKNRDLSPLLRQLHLIETSATEQWNALEQAAPPRTSDAIARATKIGLGLLDGPSAIPKRARATTARPEAPSGDLILLKGQSVDGHPIAITLRQTMRGSAPSINGTIVVGERIFVVAADRTRAIQRDPKSRRPFALVLCASAVERPGPGQAIARKRIELTLPLSAERATQSRAFNLACNTGALTIFSGGDPTELIEVLALSGGAGRSTPSSPAPIGAERFRADGLLAISLRAVIAAASARRPRSLSQLLRPGSTFNRMVSDPGAATPARRHLADLFSRELALRAAGDRIIRGQIGTLIEVELAYALDTPHPRRSTAAAFRFGEALSHHVFGRAEVASVARLSMRTAAQASPRAQMLDRVLRLHDIEAPAFTRGEDGAHRPGGLQETVDLVFDVRGSAFYVIAQSLRF